MITTIAPPSDSELDAFLGQAVTDFGAAATVAMVLVGDRLGLYEALADGGPQTPEELASRTDTHPRLVREWLHNQAAAGYVLIDGPSFALTPASAFALSDPDSPVYLGGLSGVITASTSGSTRSYAGSGLAAALAGPSTTPACSAAPRGSSGPATQLTSSASGSPRSTA